MDFEVRNNGAAGILGRHDVFLILDYYYRLNFEIINNGKVKRSHALTASQTLQSELINSKPHRTRRRRKHRIFVRLASWWIKNLFQMTAL
jgi:hypothetical protein